MSFQSNDSGLDFLNGEIPQDHLPKEESPRIQWFNGKGKVYNKISPLLANGGFEFPAKVWENELAIPGEILDIPHGDDTDEGVIYPALHISIVAKHFIWAETEEQKVVGYSRSKKWPGPGYSSRMNLWVFVKELQDLGYNKPVRLTLSGTTTGAIWTIEKQFKDEVLSAAADIGKARAYPYYMFYIPIVVGSARQASSKHPSMVTPPVKGWDINEKNKVEVLKSLYIGDQLRNDIVTRWYAEGQQWVKDEAFLSDFDNGDVPEIGHSNGTTPEPSPAINEDEIPF